MKKTCGCSIIPPLTQTQPFATLPAALSCTSTVTPHTSLSQKPAAARAETTFSDCVLQISWNLRLHPCPPMARFSLCPKSCAMWWALRPKPKSEPLISTANNPCPFAPLSPKWFTLSRIPQCKLTIHLPRDSRTGPSNKSASNQLTYVFIGSKTTSARTNFWSTGSPVLPT